MTHVSTSLFVESDDKYLRIFSMDCKTCLFLIKEYICWNLSNSGQWFITSVYHSNKNYINFHLIQDYNKLPMSSLLSGNDHKIIKIDITKSNVYLISLNEKGGISAYTIWNMELVFCLNLHKEKGSILPFFACRKQIDSIILIDNDEISAGIIDNKVIEIKYKVPNNLKKIRGMKLTNFDLGIIVYNDHIVEYWI